MKRVLRRVADTGPSEIWERSLERARTLREAGRSVVGLEGWDRRRLRSRLRADAPALRDAAAALAARDWARADAALRAHWLERPGRFVIEPRSRPHITRIVQEHWPSASGQAAASANRLLQGRHDLLGYRDLSFRTATAEIDWHYDPVHARHAPRVFWARVPYLDPRIGDHKIIWELNRHQHWLRLGRAAWLTGDSAYAAAFERELTSWCLANPPLIGINWASMLELAFRSISWIWALNFFAGIRTDANQPVVVDLLLGLDRQLDHVLSHLSTYFSPNTHLLGEGLALYVAGLSLPELTSASRWERAGRRILLSESTVQVNTDGGHAELSTHYHRYALDFYILALVVARRTGDPAAGIFAETVARLSEFCRALADDRGHLPIIGDDDGGALFPMCGRLPFDASDSLGIAAALLDRGDLAVGDPPEEAIWMLGGAPVPPAPRRAPVRQNSRLFPETGYAVLRAGRDRAVFDVGPHGFLNGGHAHADALSLVLSLDGRALLIDPGTSTYTMDVERRNRFRSTPMHNTVAIDGRDQCVADGPFHWSTRARAHLDLWRPDARVVEGWHEGYRPLVHRRTILRAPNGLWVVADHVLGTGRHEAQAYWHLSPEWTPASDRSHRIDVTNSDGSGAALATTAPEFDESFGDAEGFGWCAPVYGQLQPALTLRWSKAADAPFSILTGVAGGSRAAGLSARELDIAAGRDDGRYACAAAFSTTSSITLVLIACALPGRPRGTERSHRALTVAFGRLTTDARAAVLQCSADGVPEALIALDCTEVHWSGAGAFRLTPGPEERDLHLEGDALLRLSQEAAARPIG